MASDVLATAVLDLDLCVSRALAAHDGPKRAAPLSMNVVRWGRGTWTRLLVPIARSLNTPSPSSKVENIGSSVMRMTGRPSDAGNTDCPRETV